MLSRILTLTSIPVLWVAVAASSADREIALEADTSRSAMHFTLVGNFHTVHGAFKLKHGALRYDPATGKISGEIVADAASGESGSEGRDRRMHKDILESGRYPEIVFAPDRVEGPVAPQGTSQVQVHGVFRIHGAEHEITVPVQVQMADGQITATAHLVIPYVKWGMKNPSTLFLRVSDQVEIDATIRSR